MSDLTEAFYARLYNFYRPLTDFSFNRNQPRNKDGEWSSAKGAGGPSTANAGPTTDKMWTGVSAHPDKRVKPKSKVTFPPEPDEYENQKEANRRFARGVYDTDLGNGYASKVTQVESHGSDGMTVRGVLTLKGKEVGTFDRTLTPEKGKVLSVDHTELMINPGHRSKGLADRFNAHAVAKYQEMGVDRITLHAGAEVGGFAWARQGFRYSTPTIARTSGIRTLNMIEADVKYSRTISPADKTKLNKEINALRKAIKAGEEVLPIHLASIGEQHKWQSEDAGGRPYTNWPGKRAMMDSSWEGVYYFDASKAITAAATDLEHASLRPQFRESKPKRVRPQGAVEAAMRHMEEFYAASQPRDKEGQWAASGRTVSHIRGDIKSERRAILAELDAQGVDKMSPLRHIFEAHMGDRVAVVRDKDGAVVGGVQYLVEKGSRRVVATDMRMLEKGKGDGTAALQDIAKFAVEQGYSLSLHGAIESAKPFYSKLGAVFQTGSSGGKFTTEARDALASGKPQQGGVVEYKDWIKYDFDPPPKAKKTS